MTNFKDIKELKFAIENIKNGDIFKFRIMVNASAKNNSIEFKDEVIKIRIKEKAVDGKANKAIVEYLSDILNIPKSKIEIISGHTARIKTIAVSK